MRGFVLVAALSATLEAQQQDVRPDSARWIDFVQRFDSVNSANFVVGGSTVFVHDGKVIRRHHFGYADRGAGVRVNERTLFHYGSITKTLTAIAILQQRDRGKLSLDDKVVRWIPELRSVHDPFGLRDSITIRMLLSHSSGFQSATWPYGGADWQPFEPTSWNQLVAMMPYQRLQFSPGSRFGYSNPAYVYLARIVEQITGDPWEAYVQKQIFAPLGLARSYFNETPYYLAEDRSHNYSIRYDSATKSVRVDDNGAEFNPGITIPNGGWNAPLDDIVSYVGFLTNSSGGDAQKQRLFSAVLKRSTLEEMWRPVITADSVSLNRQSLGLGFFLVTRGTERLVGHTGSQAGFLAFVWLNPRTKDAIIVALNSASETGKVPSALSAMNRQAIDWLLSPSR